MDIRVWGEKEAESGKIPARLKLVNRSDGGVSVVAVDAAGDPLLNGNLLHITKHGIFLCCAINSDLDLPLDSYKRLILEKL